MNPKISLERFDKFAERRNELGAATLQTLGSLGYARTSLREIAQNSEFSHGVLHYYFKDKVDLILCSVRQYKALCVKRFDRVLQDSTSYDELLDGFLERLVDTLRKEAPMHRLWYDLRAQSLFDAALRADVLAIDESLETMIWRVLLRFSVFSGTKLTIPPSVAYGLFDGLFQQVLLKHVSGDGRTTDFLQQNARWILSNLAPRPRSRVKVARRRTSA